MFNVHWWNLSEGWRHIIKDTAKTLADHFSRAVGSAHFMFGKCAKHCTDSPPTADNYKCDSIVHHVHIWNCFTRSCMHTRGKISCFSSFWITGTASSLSFSSFSLPLFLLSLLFFHFPSSLLPFLFLSSSFSSFTFRLFLCFLPFLIKIVPP